MTTAVHPHLAPAPPSRPTDRSGPAGVSASDRTSGPDRRATIAAQVLDWLRPRLAPDAPVVEETVRLVGIVVHDPSFADADTSARVGWIGDGTSAHQVLLAHADDVGRYDVIVAVTWHRDGPEPRVVLVNP